MSLIRGIVTVGGFTMGSRVLGLVWLAGMVIGLLPAARAYRYSLSDGMSIRV